MGSTLSRSFSGNWLPLGPPTLGELIVAGWWANPQLPPRGNQCGNHCSTARPTNRMSKLTMVTTSLNSTPKSGLEEETKATLHQSSLSSSPKKGNEKNKRAMCNDGDDATHSDDSFELKGNWSSGNIVDYLQFFTDTGETKFATLQKLNRFNRVSKTKQFYIYRVNWWNIDNFYHEIHKSKNLWVWKP